MRSFVKIKSSRNGEIILSFTDIGTFVHHAAVAIFTSQICLLTLFAKVKFSRKFPNLQYMQRNNELTFTPNLVAAERLIFK